MGLEIPYCTFFNCPPLVEFESIHFFLIFGIRGSHFNSLHSVYFLIKCLSSHEHQGAGLSTHQHSGAFLDTQEQLRESCHGTAAPSSVHECSWVLTSAQACSLFHGTLLKSAYDWFWLRMSTQGCSWLLIIAQESSWYHDHESTHEHFKY